MADRPELPLVPPLVAVEELASTGEVAIGVPERAHIPGRGRAERVRTVLVYVVLTLIAFLFAVPFLWSAFILPAVAWLGILGFAVPAAIIERRELRAAIRRGLALARADYVHAIGSLATLVILSFLTATMLFLLLRGGSKIALSSAAFASLLLISPILFLGGGLLYFDQAARLESGGPRPRRSRDADLHHAVEPHRPGRADAEGEPRPAARRSKIFSPCSSNSSATPQHARGGSRPQERRPRDRRPAGPLTR